MKMANTNNVSERNTAVNYLLTCTQLAKKVNFSVEHQLTHLQDKLAEVNRTLKWLRGKYKNESAGPRDTCLGSVMSLLPLEVSLIPSSEDKEASAQIEAFFANWYDILQDALEDSSIGVSAGTDLARHQVTRRFFTLINSALTIFDTIGT